VSAIVWLSSSSAEIARARNVLKALAPAGVIDELGFLILNGAFAKTQVVESFAQRSLSMLPGVLRALTSILV